MCRHSAFSILGVSAVQPLLFAALLLSGAGRAADCLNCHSCETPTAADPCLRSCSRPVAPPPMSATAEVPDVVILDQLVDLYEPVVFPHRLHAEMVGMGQGCAECHHYNPPGKILACRECHGGPSNPNNLRQPSLKGAYHRQCINCHREWSHTNDCTICHAKRHHEADARATPDRSDIMGHKHPVIPAPDTKVYPTADFPEGGVATFHHKEHVELFGLSCASCHRNESCSRCHDATNHAVRKREDPHQDCAACHEVADDCALCHSAEPLPPFNHARRGLALDETHAALACADCHTQGMRKPVDCAACHDAEVSFPAHLPGTRTKEQ